MNNETQQAAVKEQAAHDEIVRRAEELWRQYGCPQGRDEEIWFEAERQLRGLDPASPSATQPSQPPVSDAVDRTRAEIFSTVEPATTSSKTTSSDAEEMKSNPQRGAARGKNGKAGRGK